MVGEVTSVGYQRTINCTDIHEFCKEWKLKINVEKTKRVVFKKGGKLSKNLKWRLKTEEKEVTNNIKYLGVIFHCRGNGRRNGNIRGN
jgi:hypothetical protein